MEKTVKEKQVLDINIKSLQQKDLGELYKLEIAAWGDLAASEKELKRRLNCEHKSVFGAYSGGKLVGNLGDMDRNGYDLLKHVRENNQSLPFYMVSGYSRADEEPKAKELGANGYLQLPIDKNQLREILN